MEKAAIVIPFYHHDLTVFEQISFRQCLKIFEKYPIILLVPNEIDKSVYISGENLIYEKVPAAWLKSVRTYNKMMLSEKFYQRFLNYEYILIYQLDAFVFDNRLEHFCSMGYDYIGAPWLCGASYYLDSKHCVWYVGNGGFSLRKVSACIKLLNEKKEMLDDDIMNEDLFFSMGQSDTFKVASVDVALSFSFEMEIERCYQRNNGKLPFGCHAWEKYHFAFWKPYIEQCGYDLKLPEGHDGEDDKKMEEYYERQRVYSRYMEQEYCGKHVLVFLESIFGKEYSPISVWGAGFYGREVCVLLQDAGIEVDYILDNDCKKQNRIIYHHRVLSLESYRKRKEQVSIIIAIKNHREEVALQLEQYGYRYKEDYIFYQDVINGIMKK